MPGELASDDDAIVFEPFRLLPAQLQLLEGGKPVPVSSRALAILTVLASRPGELVTKEELISQVWPDTAVEEGNLRVHVAALRRVLGDGLGGRRYVTTIPGRGYRFVAPVVHETAPAHADAAAPSRTSASLTRVLGRAAIVEQIIGELPKRRFITIVGPGGIGKTTVALAVTDALRGSYRDGIHFVDLTSVADPRLVPSALAAVLKLPVGSDRPDLAVALRDKQMLLVLDSCEHVVDATATLAEEIASATTRLHILATSREPLRIAQEHVQRLAALESPPASAVLTAAEALAYPAVQLFAERASGVLDTFELTDADAPVVADICRRLDGIALAIELAAGRIDAFGVRGLAEGLDDRFRLLTRGRRTALPRHQTLRATLDWSYDFLPGFERVVLRRLSIFPGSFTLASAAAISSGGGIEAALVVENIANLVSTSLVSADIAGETVYYRLLDTTRAYAREKLTESGEGDQVARRHAEHFLDLFTRADAAKPAGSGWLAVYGRHLDDIRAALDWAFASPGDEALAAALTAAAVPLWMRLSLVQECLARAEQALGGLRPGRPRDPQVEVRLLTARAGALLYTIGPGAEVNAAWEPAVALATELDDPEHRLRTYWGQWSGYLNNSEHVTALAIAERFRTLVAAGSADPFDHVLSDRMMGFSLHFRGDQTGARRHLERMLSRQSGPVGEEQIVRIHFDPVITARMRYALVLWLLGYPDQAQRTVEAAVEDLRAVDHRISICTAMGLGACPVSLATGNLDAAERHISFLLDLAAEYSMSLWQAWGSCFKGVLLIQRGAVAAGRDLLLETLERLSERRFAPWYTVFFGTLAHALGATGEVPRGLAVIDEAMARSERGGEHWCISESLRVRGELLLLRDPSDADGAAEANLRQSLDWARRQQALSWELRGAISLARLLRDRNRPGEARAVLQPVYDRFTEGFSTIDLTNARQMLGTLVG